MIFERDFLIFLNFSVFVVLKNCESYESSTTSSNGKYKNKTASNDENFGARSLYKMSSYTPNEFNSWVKRYNKSYRKYVKSKDEAVRDFKTNYENIRAHNLKSNITYTRKLQSHSDLTLEEKKAYRMGLNVDSISNQAVIPLPGDFKIARKASSVNYTRYFPPAKDQGYCGACWAFTAISLLEYISRKIGGNQFYSEQCLIDCDESNGGCDGGWPAGGLEYVRDNGISDGTLYEYEAQNGTCRKDFYPAISTIENVCTYQLNGNENRLKQLVDSGPVIVCIGTTDGFTSYGGGIFFDPLCPTNVDHAVTVVGYGSSELRMDFWIIRNSWGKDWGMNGYGHIARNRNNHCGIATYAIIVC